MEMRMDIIGDEIVVEGQVVGVLKPGLGASMRQHVEDSLRGLVLDDWSNKGTIQTEIDWDEQQERVGKFVRFARALLAKGRANRRELVAKANARVNELKVERDTLQVQLNYQQACVAQLQEGLTTALRERDEARAWAESAVKQAWEQGIETGRQQAQSYYAGR